MQYPASSLADVVSPGTLYVPPDNKKSNSFFIYFSIVLTPSAHLQDALKLIIFFVF